MDLNVTLNGGVYGPLTKSLDVEEVLMLVALTQEHPGVAEWQGEALYRLPQASRDRRQDIARMVRQKFLLVREGQFVQTPLTTLLTLQLLPQRTKRDLVLAQYLRTTPLAWQAMREVVLRRAEAAARPLAKPEDGEITVEDWNGFLSGRLNTTTASTVEKTRNHLTAHLAKFGLLEARPIPGDRIAKRFYASFYQPDPKAFWFSLVLEYAERGWTSRSLDFVANQSWTRVAYCTAPVYARFVIDEAERRNLVIAEFFGSEKQVTFRGPDMIGRVVEAVRHG